MRPWTPGYEVPAKIGCKNRVNKTYYFCLGTKKHNSWIKTLLSRNARPSDSGNYTCKPSIFKTAAVRLHVLTGRPTFPHITHLTALCLKSR